MNCFQYLSSNDANLSVSLEILLSISLTSLSIRLLDPEVTYSIKIFDFTERSSDASDPGPDLSTISLIPEVKPSNILTKAPDSAFLLSI